MQINMYMIRVRLVADANVHPLEAKPQRVVMTLAADRESALQHARDRFTDMNSAGVTVEYSEPCQLPDTIALETMVYV